MSLVHHAVSRDAVSRTDRSRAKLRTTAFDLGPGDTIRTARLAAGISQSALGRAVGVTFQQIHKYEYGEDRVSAVALQRIADALYQPARGLTRGLRDWRISDSMA